MTEAKYKEIENKFNNFKKVREITNKLGMVGDFQEVISVLDDMEIDKLVKAIEEGEDSVIKFISEPIK